LPLKDKEERRSYQAEYGKKWYAKNKKRQKDSSKRSKKRVIARNRKFIEEYKISHPCECGMTEAYCLSFHHESDDKAANVSDMVSRGYGIKKIQKEIDKCVVLCLNCHARLHHKEKIEKLSLELARS